MTVDTPMAINLSSISGGGPTIEPSDRTRGGGAQDYRVIACVEHMPWGNPHEYGRQWDISCGHAKSSEFHWVFEPNA